MGRTRVRKCCCGMSTFSGSLEKECCVWNCVSCERSKLGFFFCTLWDFSSLPSDQPEPLSAEAQSRNHWTAREFPELFFFFKWNFYLEEQLADKTIVIWIGTFAKCVLKNEWWKALTSKKAILSSYCDNKTLSFQAKPRIFGKLVSTNMTLSTSYYVLFWYQ